MKKVLFVLTLLSVITFSTSSYGQLIDEKNVTITMDLQPILQLNMTTPDNIEFVFDDIREYYSGITKYGATVLKVSSTVSWDLWAVGYSQQANSFWDCQLTYGAATNAYATKNVPLAALELHQYPANNNNTTATVFGKVDYSNTFELGAGAITIATFGKNSVYHASAGQAFYTKPGVSEKYIMGGAAQGTGGAAEGGSYMTETAMPGVNTDYYYFVIDYRIVPGLPVVFPYAGYSTAAASAGVPEAISNAGAGYYAQPGVYTMNVKYVLAED